MGSGARAGAAAGLPRGASPCRQRRIAHHTSHGPKSRGITRRRRPTVQDALGILAPFAAVQLPSAFWAASLLQSERSALLSLYERGESAWGENIAEILAAAAALEPGSSAAALVWENRWAHKFADAVRGADGMLMAWDHIPFGAVQAVMAAANKPAE
jgi:hypothetical protein